MLVRERWQNTENSFKDPRSTKKELVEGEEEGEKQKVLQVWYLIDRITCIVLFLLLDFLFTFTSCMRLRRSLDPDVVFLSHKRRGRGVIFDFNTNFKVTVFWKLRELDPRYLYYAWHILRLQCLNIILTLSQIARNSLNGIFPRPRLFSPPTTPFPDLAFAPTTPFSSDHAFTPTTPFPRPRFTSTTPYQDHVRSPTTPYAAASRRDLRCALSDPSAVGNYAATTTARRPSNSSI